MKVGDWVINIHDTTQGEIESVDMSILGYETVTIAYEISPGVKSSIFGFKSNWRVHPRRGTIQHTESSTWDKMAAESMARPSPTHVCELKDYIGLTESYSYCIHCDRKVK